MARDGNDWDAWVAYLEDAIPFWRSLHPNIGAAAEQNHSDDQRGR